MSDPDAMWLFGDQLGPHFHSTPDHRDREVLLIRSAAAFARKPFHRQKMHLVDVAIRRLAAELGDRAKIIEAPTYTAGLRRFGRPVVVHEPGSHAADALVARLRGQGLVTEILPTPGFVLTKAEFTAWAAGRQRAVMEDFYRDQRRRFGVLLEPGGEPAGGRWNFDHDNRRPPPGRSTLPVPAAWFPDEDEIDERVRHDLDHAEREGLIQPVGIDGPRRFATGAAEAEQALGRFLDHRLGTFGPHQDAMLSADWAMSHSLLSVPLNLGLLDPLDVIRRAEHRYRTGAAPLASVEGFVRQVVGWREWVWHLYWHLGPQYLRRNTLQAHRPLPDWWRELDADAVEAACLRTALAGVRDRGYAHHIERLMLLGNHALQRGYDPAALNAWFATAFVDGFPWVMPANVIGMSQYADGGVVGTKPYAAGGAYISRMSDHCGGCFYNPKKRLGADACPFTAGYWAFLNRNEPRLRHNPRMRHPLDGLARLADLPAVVSQEAGRHRF
ncbi:deoxyribodipyrimidine photolyase-related protein [Amycolatopsis xylanica]|uniref:Deoxyribodipyrimidine photolyase-related protein n=1 Tax=Amycolatopsis xylanica TaxID=589385 RepID=A0A1H2WCN9_9PSEU|nr:cryptochrome/photolyase family protein [Amycolatopsis xylanica]SDW78246.1 deoxyribodipyrimidine photolyase-related protein [Amycolatopsis xylanica]